MRLSWFAWMRLDWRQATRPASLGESVGQDRSFLAALMVLAQQSQHPHKALLDLISKFANENLFLFGGVSVMISMLIGCIMSSFAAIIKHQRSRWS